MKGALEQPQCVKKSMVQRREDPSIVFHKAQCFHLNLSAFIDTHVIKNDFVPTLLAFEQIKRKSSMCLEEIPFPFLLSQGLTNVICFHAPAKNKVKTSLSAWRLKAALL